MLSYCYTCAKSVLLCGAMTNGGAMRPNLPTISATLAAREWVRQRRAALGRPVTTDELSFFVEGRYSYLEPRDRQYVIEGASALPARRINDG